MADAVSIVSVFITFACKDLNDINSIEEFIVRLEKSYIEAELIDSLEFYDLPTKNTSENNLNQMFIANLYFLSIKLRKGVYDNKFPNPLNTKILFIITINGPWIAIDLKNEQAISEVADLTSGNGQFIKLNQGYFEHNQVPNFLKFTYNADLNKYLAIISTNQEDLDHPIYSYNKIGEYFCK